MRKQSDAAQTNKHQAAQLLFIGGMVLDENLKEFIIYDFMWCFKPYDMFQKILTWSCIWVNGFEKDCLTKYINQKLNTSLFVEQLDP